ncbi:MAG: hypothetical protein LCH52_13485 [Bacteroidetes bacterium]|nr:hypothetical protein [Bacteroidota bacterium]
MRQILFFVIFILFAYPLASQENELKAGPTQYKGGNPDFYIFPGRAALIVYSSLDNLKFKCTTDTIIGPVFEAAEKRYIVIFDTHDQVIEVSAPGFKPVLINIPSLQPSDVLPYSIEPKLAENDPGIIEVTFTISPPDAELFVDFKKTDHHLPVKLSPGNHKIKITKEGKTPLKQEIFVDKEHKTFTVTLE